MIYVMTLVCLAAFAAGWDAGWKARDEVARGYAFGMPPEYFERK